MLTVAQYGVSYQQIYSWVHKYEEKGIDGLADGRGRTKPEGEMTDEEKLQARVRLLEAQLRDKQMEVDLLKK
ncbi:MAG: helix-turn-helix domain-containing protein [Clostridiales bacterium]|nr:helix-turn-helix domain-containing protein [Clostridiales bacterium]